MPCVKVAIVLSILTPLFHHSALAQDVPGGTQRLAVTPQRSNVRFTLTPTRNFWTFLLLDSNTGRVWQVQYSLSDSTFSGRVAINEKPLATSTSAHVGRFSLQETQNFFTFLLLDQDDGRVWQIQWSTEDGQRGIAGLLSQAVP